MAGENYTLKEVVEQLRNEVRSFSKLLGEVAVKLEGLSEVYVRKDELTKEIVKVESLINDRDARMNKLMEDRHTESKEFEDKINSRVSRFLKIVGSVMILAILGLVIKGSSGLP